MFPDTESVVSFKEQASVLGEGEGGDGEADHEEGTKKLSGTSAASLKSGQSVRRASTTSGDGSDVCTALEAPTSIFLQTAAYLLDVHALKVHTYCT